MLNLKKQNELRRPGNLPLEEDIKTLRNYILKTIKDCCSNEEINESEYISLRNAVCCRLTMFNGRYGEYVILSYYCCCNI